MYQFTFTLILLLILGITACSNTQNTPKEISVVPTSDKTEKELIDTANSYYENENYILAREKWSELRNSYPQSAYSTIAELKIADSYFQNEKYTSAIQEYKKFIKNHPANIAIDYVIFQIANSHFHQYMGPDRTLAPIHQSLLYYKKIISFYSKSQYIKKSQEGIRLCREKLAEHEILVANYYLKQNKMNAFKNRKKILEEHYMNTEAFQKEITENKYMK